MNKTLLGMVIAVVSLILLQRNMIVLGLLGFIAGIATMYSWQWPGRKKRK